MPIPLLRKSNGHEEARKRHRSFNLIPRKKWSTHDIGNISLRATWELSNLARFFSFFSFSFLFFFLPPPLYRSRLKYSLCGLHRNRNFSWVVQIDARFEYLSCTIGKKRNTRLITVTGEYNRIFDFSARKQAYGSYLRAEIYFRPARSQTIVSCSLMRNLYTKIWNFDFFKLCPLSIKLAIPCVTRIKWVGMLGCIIVV